MHLSNSPNPLASRSRKTSFALLLLICLFVLPATESKSEDLHDQIINAIIGLASKDARTKEESIRFLLAAPPEFRKNINAQYRAEAENLAKSLPQQIDAYTTAQGVLVTTSELQLNYAILYDKASLNEEEVKDLQYHLTDQAKKQVCSTPGSVLLSLLYGKDLVRNYYYQTGEPFLSIRVSWDDCR